MVTEFPKYGLAVKTVRDNYNTPAFYQIINIETGLDLFHVKFVDISDDILCFFGIVHALKYRKETMSNLTVYSTSEKAVSMVKRIECKTSSKNEKILKHIETCIRWLANTYPGDKIAPIEFVKAAEENILKSDLKKWIAEQDKQPMPEITTLRRLERDFKL